MDGIFSAPLNCCQFMSGRQMRTQLVMRAVTFTAHFATIAPLSGMLPFVCLKTSFICKRLDAITTTVGPFIRMDPFVALQTCSSCKLFRAKRTREPTLLYRFMHALVIFERFRVLYFGTTNFARALRFGIFHVISFEVTV